MPDRKINFSSKLSIKTFFRTSVANTGTGSSKSLQTLLDTYLDHMLANFERNRKVLNVQNFEVFDQKKHDFFYNH